MAVLARTRAQDRLLPGAATVLDACLAAGLPLASACSGRGACGRCLVTFLAGFDGLAPAGAREQALLDRLSAGPCDRLACQVPMPGADTQATFTTGYW